MNQATHSLSYTNRIHSCLLNEFYITESMKSSLLSCDLTHMSGNQLRKLITIHNTIFWAGREYIVILPDCVKTKFFESPKLKLSFRTPKPEFGSFSYVLVRFA